MKKTEIIALLEEQGIEFDSSLKKVELEALIPVEEAVEEVAEEEVVEESPKEIVEERIHEGKIVNNSELFVLNGHSVERLSFIDGSQTIIPA